MIMKELDSDGNSQSDLNRINRSIKQNKNETVLNEALQAIPENVKHIVEQTTDKGASAWSNALSLK